MFKRLILAGAFSLLGLGNALAACTNPLSIKDATAATISMSMASGADGFCQYNFNLSQINATAVATGSGVMTAGTQRTALATDSPGIITLGQTTKSASVPMAIASDQVGTAGTANATVFTVQGVASMTKLLVTPDSVALPANQSVNVAQVNGVATSVNTGVAGTGTQRVTLSNTDPCMSPDIAKSSAAISITSATTTSIVAVSGATVVYVCGFAFTIAPSATSADTALIEYGTGAACTSPTVLTGTFGNGDLTSAAPVTLIHYGGAGQTVMKSAASAGICILSAGTAVNIQGVLTYVQQ